MLFEFNICQHVVTCSPNGLCLQIGNRVFQGEVSLLPAANIGAETAVEIRASGREKKSICNGTCDVNW